MKVTNSPRGQMMSITEFNGSTLQQVASLASIQRFQQPNSAQLNTELLRFFHNRKITPADLFTFFHFASLPTGGNGIFQSKSTKPASEFNLSRTEPSVFCGVCAILNSLKMETHLKNLLVNSSSHQF